MTHDVDRNELHGIQPVHCVRDVAASVAFYQDKLGFEVDFVEGDPPKHARVSSGDRTSASAVRIRFELSATGEAGGDTGYCYIHVGQDLDRLYERYLANGVTILSKPQDRPWRLRDFYLVDCDGYIFCFAAELS